MEVKRLSIAASMLHWAVYAALISGSTATVFSLIFAGAIWQQAAEGTEIASVGWLTVAGLPALAVLLYGIVGGLGGLIHAFLYNHLQFLPRLRVTELRLATAMKVEEAPDTDSDTDRKPLCVGFLRYLDQ